MKISFDPIAFQEAIEYFRSRLTLSPEEFENISREKKSLAFTVAHISSLDVLVAVQDKLNKAIEEGSTIREFRSTINNILEAKGFEGLTPWRADTIFRTNIQTAFQVGRYKQMTDPAVLLAKPYWMYSAVGDERTRPEHMALDGKVFPADHPFWDEWYPPNGYNCRCTVVTLSEADIQEYGLEVSETIPAMVETPQGARPLVPDPGFAFNPAKVAWEVDLSRYPLEFRQAFEDLRSRFRG